MPPARRPAIQAPRRDRRGRPACAASRAIMNALQRPPPVTNQRRGGTGKWGTARATAAAVTSTKVAAPSLTDSPATPSTEKSSRSTDLGGGRSKKGIGEVLPRPHSRRRVRSPPVRRLRRRAVRCGVRPTGRAAHCPGRCRTRRGPSPRVDPCEVGHAAQVEHRDGKLDAGQQRHVVERRERRSLSASGDVGAAEVVHHGNAKRASERRTIADLDGHRFVGAMVDSVAVKADQLGQSGCPAGSRASSSRTASAWRRVSSDFERPSWPAGPAQRPRQDGRGTPPDRDRWRTDRRREPSSPSVSIRAASIPSSEVPLISPTTQA